MKLIYKDSYRADDRSINEKLILSFISIYKEREREREKDINVSRQIYEILFYLYQITSTKQI